MDRKVVAMNIEVKGGTNDYEGLKQLLLSLGKTLLDLKAKEIVDTKWYQFRKRKRLHEEAFAIDNDIIRRLTGNDWIPYDSSRCS